MKNTHFLAIILAVTLSSSCQTRVEPHVPEDPLKTSFDQARAHQNAGEWDKAINGFMEIVTIQTDKDSCTEAKGIIREAMLQLMNTYQAAGRISGCIDTFGKLKENPTETIRESLWRDLHFIYAYALYRADENDMAQKMMDDALQMEYIQHDDRLLFRDYSYAAAILYGDPTRQDEAIAYCEMALEAAENASSGSGVQWTTSMLGQLYRKNGMMSEAMDLYMTAVDHAIELGDKAGLANVYNLISDIYICWRYPQEAEIYSDKALSIADEVRSSSASVAADIYRIRGKIKKMKGEADSAFYYHNKAQAIYEVLPYNSGNDEADKELGIILIGSEDPSQRDMGEKLLLRVIDKAYRVEPRAAAYAHLAQMHHNNGNDEGYRMMMDSMYDLLKGDPDSATYYIDEYVCRYAFEHFLSEGNVDAAGLFWSLFLQQVDRRSSDNTSRTLANSSKQEIKKQHKVELKESTKLTITVIVSSIGIIIILLLSFYAIHKKRSHKTISLVTDLENDKKKIAEELQMMAEVIKKLDTDGLQGNNPAALPAIFRKSGESLFREKFEAIYPGFLPELRNQVSNISKSEEILCMMIFLKQDLNQIAYNMGIEKASVNQARYRLRKKMGLTKEESLKQRIYDIKTQ